MEKREKNIDSDFKEDAINIILRLIGSDPVKSCVYCTG